MGSGRGVNPKWARWWSTAAIAAAGAASTIFCSGRESLVAGRRNRREGLLCADAVVASGYGTEKFVGEMRARHYRRPSRDKFAQLLASCPDGGGLDTVDGGRRCPTSPREWPF